MHETHDPLTPRPVRDSQSEMNEIVLPNDTNPLGALLGGRLMHWIDLAGALAAHRHSRNYVVTASIDHLDFWTPVHVGDLVVLRSSVNRVFTTSMEVGVQVSVENYLADECKHVSSAYLTFVAVWGEPLTLAGLRGRFVLLDFWTFCCGNCLHVLDELRPLEAEFGDVLTVVGIHSPKFPHEADPQALRAAIERYDVDRLVTSDAAGSPRYRARTSFI